MRAPENNTNEFPASAYDESIPKKGAAQEDEASKHEISADSHAETSSPPPANAIVEFDGIQKGLIDIQTALNALITSEKANPSTLINLVHQWNELNLTQRLMVLSMAAPTALAGATLGNSFIVGASVSGFVSLSVGGHLADQHIEITKKNEADFQSAVTKIVELVGFTTSSLDQLRKKLKSQVEILTQQNNLYEDNINKIESELYIAQRNLAALSVTEEKFRLDTEKLKATIGELMESKEKDVIKIAQCENELKNAAVEHNRCLTEIKTQNLLIEELKISMGNEINQLQTVTNALSNTLTIITNKSISPEEQRAYQQKLIDVLKSQAEETQKGFTTSINELESVKNELAKYKTLFTELLEETRQKKHEAEEVLAIIKNPEHGEDYKHNMEKLGLFYNAPSRENDTEAPPAYDNTVRI